MEYSKTYIQPIQPRIIIHGGAGNITRNNLPPHLWRQHRDALLSILRATHTLLHSPAPRAHLSYAPPATANLNAHTTLAPEKPPHRTTALTAATHAVRLLEENPFFNAARGAVFNRAGRIELEASVMVSRGYKKRGVGISLVRRVKSPVCLAGEMLRKGELDADSDRGGWGEGEQERNGGDGAGGVGGGGAQGHCQLSGEEVEKLAESWGLEMCEEKWFWTRKRWEEHRRGLAREKKGHHHADVEDVTAPAGHVWAMIDPSWNGYDYLPQGTVGCVVLDSYGTICVATSTGGITNKLPGRIGDTPTLGAGFWAEEWMDDFVRAESGRMFRQPALLPVILGNLTDLDVFGLLRDCLPQSSTHDRVTDESCMFARSQPTRHAVAMSGTGNGDSFLRTSAVRTAAAKARFSSHPTVSLASAVEWMAGPGGQLQLSAEDRWHRTGEGEGGIIGIELVERDGGWQSNVVADYNCGGMFRCWIDEKGGERCMVFREEYETEDR